MAPLPLATAGAQQGNTNEEEREDFPLLPQNNSLEEEVKHLYSDFSYLILLGLNPAQRRTAHRAEDEDANPCAHRLILSPPPDGNF